MVAHPNRKQSTIRLTDLERRALVGIIDEAIARMKAMQRNPQLLERIRQKISNTGE